MRKTMIACVLGLAALGMVSCGGWLETSDNGKLDGNWYLTQIDSLSGDSMTGSVDMTADRKFLAVQGKLLVVHDADEAPQYMFRFDYTDGTLKLSDARLNDRTVGDPPLTDVEALRPFGINSLEETFAVDFPSGGKMVLTSGQLRLMLKKF